MPSLVLWPERTSPRQAGGRQASRLRGPVGRSVSVRDRGSIRPPSRTPRQHGFYPTTQFHLGEHLNLTHRTPDRCSETDCEYPSNHGQNPKIYNVHGKGCIVALCTRAELIRLVETNSTQLPELVRYKV